MLLSSPESQRHCTFTHRPLEQLNCVRGSQVGKAEKVCLQKKKKRTGVKETEQTNKQILKLNESLDNNPEHHLMIR